MERRTNEHRLQQELRWQSQEMAKKHACRDHDDSEIIEKSSSLRWIAPLATLPLFLIVSAVCSIVYFRRIAGLDVRMAYFCGMPGGLVEMVLLGGSYGASG